MTVAQVDELIKICQEALEQIRKAEKETWWVLEEMRELRQKLVSAPLEAESPEMERFLARLKQMLGLIAKTEVIFGTEEKG